MHDRIAASPPAQATDVIARAVGAVALVIAAAVCTAYARDSHYRRGIPLYTSIKGSYG